MKKALIIDDTKNIRLMLSKCLELDGYEVEMAENGKKGLELIKNTPADLVFLDIKLPEMSGTEVLRRIRNMGINTPVIIITAYPTVKNAVDCVQMGAITYLQKPFTAARLKNVLNELNLGEESIEVDALIRAEEYMKEGKLVQAEDVIKKRLAEEPENAQCYRLLGDLYEKKGEGNKAKKFFGAAALFEDR